ncbi:MAG: FecR family protein [Candidatus Krumholzibacteriia bacterium]
MSRDDLQRNPDEQRALDALRGLGTPRPSNAARARARAAFLAAPGVETPAPAPVGQAPAARPRRANWLVPVAAAAVLAMAVFGIVEYANGPRATWRVTDVVEPGGLIGAPTEGFVTEYGRITTGPETELELQLGGQFRLRLRPGTEMELPAPPRRWQPREMVLTLLGGEVYGIAKDLDAPLRVVARNSETLVRGTTFAVFQTPEASCTCLWEGSVEITGRTSGEVFTLDAGKRYLVYNDGTASGPQPLDAGEVMKLQMLHDAGLLPDPADKR